MLHIGARLARRFTLLSTLDSDAPGVERFRASDSRLHQEVCVDVITALAPSEVRQAAASAARIRDPRLLRIIASGRERMGDESFTYVVTERPSGTPLSALLERRRVPARLAGTIVGEAARALVKADSEGVHHGYLRPSSLSVSNSGRVTVAGLGIDGELAIQAGLGRGSSEAADAAALGRIYLAAITGLDADAATERDLPADLGVRGRKLCIQVINGTGPTSLDAVIRSFAPIDTRVLQGFPALVRAMPLLPSARTRPTSPPADVGIVIAEEVPLRADHATREDWAEAHTNPKLSVTLSEVDASTGLGIVPPDQAAQHASADSGLAPILKEAQAPRPGVDAPLGANELHDLYEFDEMVEVQDVNNTTSTMEALLERMHRRWPKSELITRRLDHAHARANRAGPIKAAPVLIPLFVIAVIIAAIVAFQALSTPLGENQGPGTSTENPYPAFTNSPSPTPSAASDGE